MYAYMALDQLRASRVANNHLRRTRVSFPSLRVKAHTHTHSQALAHNHGHDSIRPGTLPAALEAWDVQLGGLGHHPVRKTSSRAAIEQPFVCASPVRTRAIALQRSCCDRRLCRRHVPQTLSVDNLDWWRAEMRHHNFENVAFGTPQDMAEYIGKPSLMCSARLVVQRTPLGMSPTPCPPSPPPPPKPRAGG